MSQPTTIPPVPPPQPPRKIWPWVLGAGCGVMLLVCCGVGGALFYVGAKVAQGVSQDPVVVREVASSIAEIELPPELAPKFSMKLPFPTMDMTLVIFGDGENMVMLGDMQGTAFANATPEALARQMEDSMRTQTGNRESINAESTEKREFTIRGKPAEFVFTEGTGANSQKKLTEVMGAFPSEEGFVIVVIHAEAEKFSKEQLVEIIESIK